MSGKIVVMAGLAVAFGATSYFAGNEWLESRTQAALSELETNRVETGPAVEMATVVVAAEPLVFGQAITDEMVKTIEWPQGALPDGVFTDIKTLIGDDNRRVVKSMEPGEPIMISKVTGENSKAGLAGIIAPGMRAVTIPVDMVNGVGGFVMPGDRVDIVLTRRIEDGEREGEQAAKIIMENVKVLSIDQQAETRLSEAQVAKSVTLETDSGGAQKLALANNVGSLSLLLRGAGDSATVGNGSMSSSDLSGNGGKSQDSNGFFSMFTGGNKEEQEKKFATVRVIRLDEATEVTVPVDGKEADGKAKAVQ